MKTLLHSKNKIILLTAIGIILTIIVGLIFFIPHYLSRNILTVSFYGLPSSTRFAFEQTLNDLTKTETNDTSFNFIILDNSLPLEEQLTKKMDLVFTLAGKNAQSILPQAISVNPAIYNNFPYSIGQTGISPDGEPQSVPLLLDHFEVAYHIKRLQQFNDGTPPRSFEQLESFARFILRTTPESGHPITIAGGNDDALLLFISALVESHYGTEGYNKLVNLLNTEQLQSKEDFDRFIAEPLIETTEPSQANNLSDILSIIGQWQNEQLVHPNWTSLTNSDLIAFIELQKPAILFLPLSIHRTVPLREIRQYSATWFPSGGTATSRSLVIPTVLGIALSEKSIQTDPDTDTTLNAVSLLASLASENTQAVLSEEAELATVHSRAQALDKQASDVRLWAASSESLLPSIAQSAFETPAQIAVFADYVRNWLSAFTF